MEKWVCQDCVCLVEGINKDWFCDQWGKPIDAIKECGEWDELPSKEV